MSTLRNRLFFIVSRHTLFPLARPSDGFLGEEEDHRVEQLKLDVGIAEDLLLYKASHKEIHGHGNYLCENLKNHEQGGALESFL